MLKGLIVLSCGISICEARQGKTSRIETIRSKGRAQTPDTVLAGERVFDRRSSSVREKSIDEGSAPEKLQHFLFALHPSFRAAGTVGLRRFPSTVQRTWEPQQSFKSRAPEPPPTSPEPRGRLRVLGTFNLWIVLLLYAAFFAPGKDAVAQALDAELLQKLISNPFDPTVPPFLSCVFNFMGLWPAWYAAVLLPGAAKQKPLPAAPFLVGSLAFGMFSLAPYLALREYRDDGITQADLNGLTRWTEGKLNAILLSLGAVSLFAYGALATDFDVVRGASEYLELFRNQMFAHVMSLDFLALWVLSYGVLVEDAKRRGIDNPSPFFAAVPIVGHMAWLLSRPPLPEE